MSELIKIENQDIEVKEYNNVKVLTFDDIDKFHQRPSGTAKRNFNTNKCHFVENEDYFEIKGQNLKDLKLSTNFVSTFAPSLILLTQTGYLMIVKSFTDDLSWRIQKVLVNNYFNRINNNLIQQQNIDLTQYKELEQITKTNVIDIYETKEELNKYNKLFKDLKELSENQAQQIKELQFKLEPRANKKWIELQKHKMMVISTIFNSEREDFVSPKEILSKTYGQLKKQVDIEKYNQNYKQRNKTNIIHSVLDVIADDEVLRFVFEQELETEFFMMGYLYLENTEDDYYKKLPLMFEQISDNIYRVKTNTNIFIKKRKLIRNFFKQYDNYEQWKDKVKTYLSKRLDEYNLQEQKDSYMKVFILRFTGMVEEVYKDKLSTIEDIDNILAVIYHTRVKEGFEEKLSLEFLQHNDIHFSFDEYMSK